MEPFATETLTIGATATTLTAATYTTAKRALITVETANIRWWPNGSTPTSTQGHLALPGDVIELNGLLALQRFSAIRATSTSATIQASYDR